MEYVEAHWDEALQAYWSDPREYLARLPDLLPRLPKGARGYAADPGHYDFYGSRCVKDLRPSRIEFPAEGHLRIAFAPNPFKHEHGLTVEYAEVSSFSLDTLNTLGSPGGGGLENLGVVMLDEILPTDHGCTHEVAFTSGTVKVACGDLTATWTP